MTVSILIISTIQRWPCFEIIWKSKPSRSTQILIMKTTLKNCITETAWNWSRFTITFTQFTYWCGASLSGILEIQSLLNHPKRKMVIFMQEGLKTWKIMVFNISKWSINWKYCRKRCYMITMNFWTKKYFWKELTYFVTLLLKWLQSK